MHRPSNIKIMNSGVNPHKSSNHKEDTDDVITVKAFDKNGKKITTYHVREGGLYSKHQSKGGYTPFKKPS